MAQYFGQSQMSKAPNALDYLKKKEQEKNKFNLFDFSDVTPKPQLNFGPGMSGPGITNFQDFKANIPQQAPQTQPTQQSGFSLVPTENAMEEEDLLQQYLKDPKQDNNSKQQLFQALQDGESPESIINYLQTSGYKGTQPQAPQDINDMGLLEEGGQRLSNLGTKLGERAGKFGEAFTKERSQNPFMAGLQNLGAGIGAVGQIAGGIGDIVFEGLAYVTPDIVKETLTGGAKKAWENTPEVVKQTAINAIKVGGEEYKQFKQNNPFLADTLEGSLNIASIAPIGYGGKVAGKGIEKTGEVLTKGGKQVINKLTPDLQKTVSKVSTKANRFNAVDEEKFIKTTGQTPGEFAVQRGMTDVGDKAVEKATQNYLTSMKQADDAFENVGGNFKYTGKGNDPIKLSLDDLETRGIKTEADFTPRIQELKQKYETEGLTMPEINEVKREYSRNFKYGFEDRNSEALARSTNIQNKIREWQLNKADEMGVSNIREINKNTQAWKLYADALEKKLNRSGANNAVSITDWIALSGGDATNVALFLGKKLGTSDKAKELLIKTLGKKTKEAIISPDINKPKIKGLLPKGPIITPKPEFKSGIKVTPAIIQPNIKTQKALPPGKVVTPQTSEKGIIQESKIPLKNTKYDTNNNIPSNMNNTRMETILKPNQPTNVSNKTIKKPSETGREVLKPKKSYDNKAGFINPLQVLSDIKEGGKSVIEASKRVLKSMENPNIPKAKSLYEELKAKGYTPLEAQIKTVKETGVPAYKFSKAGTLGGVGAKEAPTNLSRAQTMEKSGKSADDIWKETGWEKGTDGKWRFEIDDSDYRYLPATKERFWKDKRDMWTEKLGDTIDHPSLFKQYPELKNIKVSTVDFGKNDIRGNINGDVIELNKHNSDLENHSVLLHEIQHYIQSKEGFARGGNTASFGALKNLKNKYGVDISSLDEFDKFISGIKKEYSDTYNLWEKKAFGKKYIGQKKEVDFLFNKYKDLKEKINNLENFKLSKEDFKSSYLQYQSLAGETEARNVQSRLLNTPEERKLIRPAKTEDVARDKQIVKMEGGKSMLLPTNSKQVSKVSDDLISEAKKYKSAEEFIKAQGDIVYHGSNSIGKHGVPGGVIKEWKVGIPTMRSDKSAGIYFGNKVVGERYARDGKGILYEARLGIKNPKEFPATVEGYMKFGTLDQEDVKQMIKEGYDGAHINASWKDDKGGSNDEWFAIYPERIKTDAQLKQIYEQANKPKLLKKTESKVSDDLIKFEGGEYFKKGDKYFKRYTGLLGENKGKVIEKEVINPGTIKELEVFKQKGMKGVEELRNKQLQEFKQRQIDRTKEKELLSNKKENKLNINDLTITKTKLPNYTLYHGTSSINLPKILKEGFKAGNELPENAFRGGGHGAIQNSISFSLDPKISANFTGTGNKGGLITVTINKDANIVKIPQVEGEYAEYLNDIIPDLKKKGIDAIYIGGEDELVVINKNIIKITGSREFNVGKTNQELKNIFEQANKHKPLKKAK